MIYQETFIRTYAQEKSIKKRPFHKVLRLQLVLIFTHKHLLLLNYENTNINILQGILDSLKKKKKLPAPDYEHDLYDMKKDIMCAWE